MKASLSQTTETAKLSRDELLRRLDSARRDPEMGRVIGAFHKRKPGEASDEELHALLAEIEMLRGLTASKRDKSGGSKNQ